LRKATPLPHFFVSNMFRSHLSDHSLELYCLDMVEQEQELIRVEEHLLSCPECVDRAQRANEYVSIMRECLLGFAQPASLRAAADMHWEE